MAYTLRDLIDELEDLSVDVGDEAEVRLAFQPRWAFEHSVGNLVAMPAKGKTPARVYLGEGDQIGYLPHNASVALGWAERRPGDDEDEDDDE